MFKQKLTPSLSLSAHSYASQRTWKITKEERKKQSLIKYHEEDHPSCHCYTIGAPAPATAPTQLSCLFLCVRERETGTLSPVIPLKILDRLTCDQFSDCTVSVRLCVNCACVYSDFHHPLVSIAAESNSNTEVL